MIYKNRADTLVFLTVAALVGTGVAAAPRQTASADQPVAVIATAVPLNTRDKKQIRIGKLLYRGGIALRASDRRFGGFSGLHVSPGGQRLIAISDRGHRMSARIRHDADGNLSGLGKSRMAALLGPNGKLLQGLNADSEALAYLPDGSALVAFERRHRIYLYPPSRVPLSGRPVLWSRPANLVKAPDNGGIESLAHVGGGFLLALSENLRTSGGNLAGWIGRERNWKPLNYVRTPGYYPTDATLMPDGNVVVLERKYTVSNGFSVRVMVVPRRSIAPGRTVKGRLILHLTAPMTVDNFEGIATRRGHDGRGFLYLISDDNFNPLQRTLLMMFETP